MTQTHSDTDQTQSQTPSSQPYPDEQAMFDQSFTQISQGQGQGVDWAREYFDSLDTRILDWQAQVRSARRVAEVAALGHIENRIVAKAAYVSKQQVLAALRTDPTLRQQVMSEAGSGSSKR